MQEESEEPVSNFRDAPSDDEFLPLKLKRLLLGSPIPTFREKQQRLPKVLGLAVFSSAALSPVAYALVAAQMSLRELQPSQERSQPTVLLPVSGVYKQVINALQYARLLSQDVRAVYIELDPEVTLNRRHEWRTWGYGVPLLVLYSPYRSIVQPFLHYIEQIQDESPDRIVTVILPEFVSAEWWQHILYNQYSRRESLSPACPIT